MMVRDEVVRCEDAYTSYDWCCCLEVLPLEWYPHELDKK